MSWVFWMVVLSGLGIVSMLLGLRLGRTIKKKARK
jgi:hypothetical protein